MATTSVAHCGACGVTCAGAPDAMAACVDGTCALACREGRGDCDGVRSNGCEQDVAADARHCGACGSACADGRRCVAGACTASACVAGRANCDGAEANGCEVTLATDALHCGACGNACALPNAVAECAWGVCGFSVCAVGWADCDGLRSNGCEASLGATTSCGGCGVACGVGEACDGGACRRPVFTVSNANDAGDGSLRAALTAVNASPAGGRVVFAIAPGGPQTIHLQSFLPTVSRRVELEGGTQPGFAGAPIVTLDYGALALGAPLALSAGDSVVRDLKFVGRVVVLVHLMRCDRCLAENLHLSSGGGGRASAPGLYLTGSRGPTVRRVQVRERSQGIFVDGGADVTLVDNDVRGCGLPRGIADSAITVLGAAAETFPGGVRIRGNRFGETDGSNLYVTATAPLTVAGSSGPGVDIALERADGVWDTSSTAVRLTLGRGGVVRDLDLSWTGAPVLGSALDISGQGFSIERVRVSARTGGGIMLMPVNGSPNSVRCVSASLTTLGPGPVNVRDSDFTGQAVVAGESFVGALNADGNWWGAPSGPSNLGGAGASFSGSVVVTDWLAARPACAP